MNCAPNNLAMLAACFSGLQTPQLQAATTYLVCQYAAGGGAHGAAILLETGDYILTEDGNRILTETTQPPPPMNSAQFPLLPGTDLSVTIPHGLGVAPNYVRLVLLCVSADTDYSPGQEIEAYNVLVTDDQVAGFRAVSDATNIWIVGQTTAGGGVKIGPYIDTLTSISNFQLKVYYNQFA